MSEPPLDFVHIRDLQLRCIIGVNKEEREKIQDVILNITMAVDLTRPCRTDHLEDTLDYKELKKSIVALVEDSTFFLIERLGQAVADRCLENPLVHSVEVTVDKPGALRFARSVAIRIQRHRQGEAP